MLRKILNSRAAAKNSFSQRQLENPKSMICGRYSYPLCRSLVTKKNPERGTDSEGLFLEPLTADWTETNWDDQFEGM